MKQFFHILLYQPLVNLLILLYRISGNFGLAIIGLTAVIRLLLIPLTLPSLKAAEKLKALAPEIEKLKKKYGSDKQKLSQAQLELYRQHGANPAAGCLPQIIQLIVLIALYQAFFQVLKADGELISKLNQLLYSGLQLPVETTINLRFLYLDLSKPDVLRIPGLSFPLPGFFLLLSALVQFASSKMMQPAVAFSREKAKKTAGSQDDMATMMQSQMLYMFPLMTILIGYSFPSGLVLYWFIFSLSTALQQYYVSGWGGLRPWIDKLKKGNIDGKKGN